MDPQENPTPSSESYMRWTCPNHSSPVLLAMVDNEGHLQIKVRNRVWLINDFTTVTATCPKCGRRHTRRITED